MTGWQADWAWSLPLIVLNVTLHVLGLGLTNQMIFRVLGGAVGRRHFIAAFVLVMGITVLLTTALHGAEGMLWAGAYLVLGALADAKSAMLYSIGAMTTYGHANILLEARWQLMGPLEALNGMLLFGLTTAFLFRMIERVGQLGGTAKARRHYSEEGK